MDVSRSPYGDRRRVFTVLVGKPDGKRRFGVTQTYRNTLYNNNNNSNNTYSV